MRKGESSELMVPAPDGGVEAWFGIRKWCPQGGRPLTERIPVRWSGRKFPSRRTLRARSAGGPQRPSRRSLALWQAAWVTDRVAEEGCGRRQAGRVRTKTRIRHSRIRSDAPRRTPQESRALRGSWRRPPQSSFPFSLCSPTSVVAGFPLAANDIDPLVRPAGLMDAPPEVPGPGLA